MTDDELADLIRIAHDLEASTGKRQYVVWIDTEGEYEITGRMPLMGEWYDADGIQHGSR